MDLWAAFCTGLGLGLVGVGSAHLTARLLTRPGISEDRPQSLTVGRNIINKDLPPPPPDNPAPGNTPKDDGDEDVRAQLIESLSRNSDLNKENIVLLCDCLRLQQKNDRLKAENDDLKVELAALKMIHQNEHQFAEHLG